MSGSQSLLGLIQALAAETHLELSEGTDNLVSIIIESITSPEPGNEAEIPATISDSPDFVTSIRRLIFHFLSKDVYAISNDNDKKRRIKDGNECNDEMIQMRVMGKLLKCLRIITRHECFDLTVKSAVFSGFVTKIIKACFYRCSFCDENEAKENKGEVAYLVFLMHSAYLFAGKEERKYVRKFIGAVLKLGVSSDSVQEHYKQINMALRLCGFISQGFAKPLSPSNIKLFQVLLLPFHKLQGVIMEHKPALGLIHMSLMFSLLSMLDKEEVLTIDLISCIFKNWPKSHAGNSPKEILLLNELESVLEHGASNLLKNKSNKYDYLIEDIVGKLRFGLSSQHSVICQKTLFFWKNDRVLSLFCGWGKSFLSATLPIILTSTIEHWNSTVRKMAALVLKMYVNSDDEELRACFFDVVSEILATKTQDHNIVRNYIEAILLKNDIVLKNEAEDISQFQSDSLQSGDRVVVPEKRFDLNVMNMVIGDEIGHGTFGYVYVCYKVIKGKLRAEWPKYAVKEIGREHETYANKEIKIMSEINHPNCLTLIGHYSTSATINLVMEYAEKGDLHSILVENISIQIENIRFISGEIISAINYFHEKSLVYGDLKPENILVFNNGHIKLCDFGAVRPLESLQQGAQIEGTYIYLAPELAAGESGTTAIDYWSLGCLVYQMYYGKPPFHVQLNSLVQTNPRHTFLKENSNPQVEIIRFKKGKDDTVNDTVKTSLLDLITKLLQRDYSNRLDFHGCELHPFYMVFQNANLGFDDLNTTKAPPIKSSTNKSTNRVHGGDMAKTGWTQRSYSMMISPVPKKISFDSDSYHMKLIPENPGEEKYDWYSATGILLVNDVSSFNSFRIDVQEVSNETAKTSNDEKPFVSSQSMLTNTAMRILQRSNYGNAALSDMMKRNKRSPVGGSKSRRPRNMASNKASFMTVAPHMLGSANPTTRKRGESSKRQNKSSFVVNDIDLTAG